MKLIFATVITLFAFQWIYAQEPSDALRFSWLTQQGTARNQAIGGAGGSLGGEFSSTFINPAGLGFYKTNDFVFTPSYSLKSVKSTYKGSGADDKENNFNLGASGLLFSSPSQNKAVKSITFAIGINRAADFRNHIYYKGQNNTSSYSEKYLEELINNNVTDPNDAGTKYPYGSSLAFNTFLLDTLQAADGTLAGYRSVADPSFGLSQENNIYTEGGITDLSLGLGLNLKEKLFFGGTITFPFLNYYRDATYKESDLSGNTSNNFNYFESKETLETRGVGVNGKFGLIYKPVEDVRLGVAVHTPTFYQLTDKYTAEVITDLEGYGGAGLKHQSSLDLNGAPLESKYNLSTPLKLIASASYLLREVEDVQQQKGFITADLEYINYAGSRFTAVDRTDGDAKDYYSSLNNTIKNLYKSAINVRLGGEVKMNTFMFRLGGAFYGNPYKNESANLVKISGGVGYRNKGMFIDLTYVQSMNKDVHYPYLLQDKANAPAYLKKNAGNIIATIGFKI